MLDSLKIALVCDWLTVYGGAERVFLEMHELFPKAPIYTTLYNSKRCFPFEEADIRESYLKWIPGARSFHQLLLPLMPKVFERMDFSDYDLVISSSHSAAKGILTSPKTLHVSYCHSPMRYVWDQSHRYQKGYRPLRALRFLYQPFLHGIRIWDRLAAERVDRFVSNSVYVKDRIKKYYHRDAEVIWPPVNLESFTVSDRERTYYLAVGRLIPYKSFDLIIEAANELGIPLKIVGVGSEMRRLKRLAGDTVEFLGAVSDDELAQTYQGAKALIFPQVEDFGIVPLEAMACGTPVLAYGWGGALETVQNGVGGLFYPENTVSSLTKCIRDFESRSWDPNVVAESVEKFSRARFKAEFLHFLERAWREHQEMLA